MTHDDLQCATWHIHTCDMTHACVPWLIFLWQSFTRYDSCMCDTTHDDLQRATWHIHTCDKTQSCAPWLIHLWHSFTRRDSCMCDMTHDDLQCATRHLHICDITDPCATWLLMWDMTLITTYLVLQSPRMRPTWDSRMRAMGLNRVWHDSLMCSMPHSCATCLISVHHEYAPIIWLRSWMCIFFVRLQHPATQLHDTLPHDMLRFPCMRLPWFNQMCCMTHSSMTWLIHMWHDSFMTHTECAGSELNTILSVHTWMSHIAVEWVMPHLNVSGHAAHHVYRIGAKDSRAMSHTDESCHIWMSHVTYGWVMSHMDESCHTWMHHVTYGWVMSHVDESCHTKSCPRERVVSHMDESCHTKSCHKWMSHVTNEWVVPHVNQPCHTKSYHKWVSHVTHGWIMSHMDESCHIKSVHT